MSTRRRLRHRALAVAAVILIAPIFAITAAGTLDWFGRPFPGFFLMGNAVVPTIGLSHWTGIQAGVPFHARVVALDGHAVDTSADVYEYVGSRPVGTPVQYTLVKGGHTLTRTVASMRFGGRDYWLTVGFYMVFGVLSVATGLGVYLLQPRDPAARAFMIQGVVTGLFALTGAALYHPDEWWLSRLHFVTQTVFPAAFIHLGLTFPVPRRFVAKHPGWLAAPYAVAAILSSWVFLEFYASPPRTIPLYAAYLYSAFAIGLLVVLVAYAYWENRTPRVRPQLRLVIPGLCLGTGVALVGFLNIARGGGDFPMNYIAIPPVLFYLSVAYAIARHDLFDVDALVKQAITYATLTLVITLAYAGSLVLLGLWMPPQAVRSSAAFNVAFVVMVAFLFEPLRRRVQHRIDRTFYRSRPGYRATVRELTAALTTLLDLEEILGRVGRIVTDGLQLETLAVALWNREEMQAWRYDPLHGRLEADPVGRYRALRDAISAQGAHPVQIGVGAAEEEHGSGEQDDVAADTGDAMAGLGIALLLPLTLGGRIIGCLALGPRRSGRHFTREDVDLLVTLGDQSAIAIRNAQSYRELQLLNEELEEKVLARTTALEASNAELARAYRDLQTAHAQLLQTEKMASLGQLAAGVAHEINNPVTFIVGNIEPLRRHLTRLRDIARRHADPDLGSAVDRMGDVLEVVARGAERTAGIVHDLRTFSRVGETARKPVDLRDGIEVSLRLLRPRWAGRIEIHRAYGNVPRVEAAPDQINQVFMNLLVNACDAIRERGNIWIDTDCEGDRVRVTIRDDGGGIPEQHLHKIFDPFFTTKPIGEGTGMGLAISQGIVAEHRGTIRVESTPDRGTTFTVTLPVGKGTDRERGEP